MVVGRGPLGQLPGQSLFADVVGGLEDPLRAGPGTLSQETSNVIEHPCQHLESQPPLQTLAKTSEGTKRDTLNVKKNNPLFGWTLVTCSKKAAYLNKKNIAETTRQKKLETQPPKKSRINAFKIENLCNVGSFKRENPNDNFSFRGKTSRSERFIIRFGA